MASCLVITPEELKPYKELGLNIHEITQDYLENGVLRSPMAISHKIKARKEEIKDNYFDKLDPNEDFLSEAQEFDNQVAESWVFKLSKALGVEAQVVTRDQAKRLHAEKEVAYNNENAFFTDSTAYFVEGTLTPESVVHEFSHPLIKSLDPSLKNKLFNDLINDPELNGKAILDQVNELYNKDGQMSESAIQEEVLVRALTSLIGAEKNTPKVQNWLQKLMYQLKQMLRKLLGRTSDVKNLQGDTSLKDLANMVAKGDVLELQKEMIDSSDVIEHFKELQDFIDNFDEVMDNPGGKANIQQMIDDVVRITMDQKQDILNNPEFFELQDEFVNELNRQGILNEIMDKLGSESTRNQAVISMAKKDKDNGQFTMTMDQVRQRVSNLSHTMHKLNDLFDVMNKELAEIKDINSEEKLRRLIYHKKFVLNWMNFIQLAKRESIGQAENNPVKELVDKLDDKLSKARTEIERIQAAAVKDVFVELMEIPTTLAQENFEKELKKQKNNTAGGQKAQQRRIDRVYLDHNNMTEAEYLRFKEMESQGYDPKNNDEMNNLFQKWLVGNEFNEMKAEAILKGDAFDAKIVQGMIESLTMNTDPAVRSVYDHIQKLTGKYEAEALDWYADFVNAALPYVKKNEGKVQQRGKIGETVGFKDVVASINENTGEVSKVEEWSFLSEWREYKFDQAELKHRVKIAAEKFEATNSDADKQAFYDAQHEYQLWKNEYMNQKYSSEYYKANALLTKDDLGREANDKRMELFDEISDLENDNYGGKNDELIDNLRSSLKQLTMTTDLLGNQKTGRELEIAERLKEYSEARSKFFIEDEIPGAFEKAYKEYGQFLESKGNVSTSTAYEDAMQNWLRRNTRTVLKNSVFEKREALIAEKEELLSRLNAKNKEIFDDTDLQRLINEQSNLVKDTGNQPDGRESKADARDKVRKAHEELEEKRKDIITRTGLSVNQTSRYKELAKEYKENGDKWIDQSSADEWQTLNEKKLKSIKDFGLDQVVLKRLSAIDEQLRGLISYVPTDYYKNVMTELLENGPSEQAFLDFSAKKGYVYNSIYEATNEDFSDFAASDEMQKLMKTDSKLKTFVEQNHYERGKKLVPTNLWTTAVSPDPYNYESKRLRIDGKDMGLIKLDDQYRIPSGSFYTRVVKDEFVTKQVVGKTVDNKGNFLPKAESTNRYRNAKYYELKENDPEAFKFLEDIKAQYLKGQEDAEKSDRLYLSFPKMTVSRLEGVRKGNTMGRYVRRVRDSIFGREDDVLEYKSMKEETMRDKHSLRGYSLISTDPSMPVIGAYSDSAYGGAKIDVRDVSTDVLKTVPEYIASIKHKKGAKEANSYARLMQDTLKDNPIDEQNSMDMVKKLSRNSHQENVANRFAKKGLEKLSKREKVINALVERDIDGIRSTGWGSEAKWLNRLLDSMTKRSSKMNFNWNLMSGTVNYGQIKITSYTHALSADELDMRHALKGEAWAMKTAMQVSRDLRKRDHKSLDEQLFLLFDAISGRAADTMGDSLSRTYVADLLDGKLTQNARHWMELQGTLQNFGGLMYKKKVSITDANGTRTVPYIKAFELDADGKIKTKDGIEAGYEVSYDKDGKIQLGEKMLNQKHYMQSVIMKWNGAFAKKDAPLIGRWILAKQMLFLKKHVIPIASKQYAFEMGTRRGVLPSIKKRMNWNTGVAEYGHWTGTLMLLKETIMQYGTNLPSMTAKEIKSAAFVFFQLFIGGVVLPYLWRLLTPTYVDPDDPDEREKVDYKAMNHRSGWYDQGLFGKDGYGLYEDQDYYEFQLDGYLLNMLSMTTTKLKDEYNAVNWLGHPDGISDLFGQSTSQSISAKQTLSYYLNAIKMMTGESPSTPSRDGGPYFFQQEGYQNGNILKLLFRFHGFNGKMIDPTRTQQGYEQVKRTK
jgi:hypothetical protein